VTTGSDIVTGEPKMRRDASGKIDAFSQKDTEANFVQSLSY